MNDNNLEYEYVRVTPESMDAHVQCLKENGYNINKTFALFSKYIFAFLLGGYLIKLIS
jgi:N6-adenosine-specific RNA methylase IME4